LKIETKRNETKRNETKRNETKRNETKRNETKRNETKRNEKKMKGQETKRKNLRNGTKKKINPDFFKCRYIRTLTAKGYFSKTAGRMIELTTYSQGTFALASSQSSNFDNEVEASIWLQNKTSLNENKNETCLSVS
jgi:hypothetical protein